MFSKKVVIYLALIFIFLTLLGATGCAVVTGSGEIASWYMDYTDFNRIEVGSSFDVTVTRADSYLVRITIDKKLYEYLKIDQRGDTLHIGLKPNYIYTEATRQAIVNLPDLRRLGLSGASKALVNGFSVSHSLDFELSGASQMGLGHIIAGNSGFALSGASKVNGNIEMDDGRFDLSGASTLELQGSADDVTIEASGASDVKLPDFAVTSAEVNLSGASNAVINVSSRMDVNLSGASDLVYIGEPKLGKLNISGGSTINQRQ
jgi:hypothetical protein